MITRNEELPKLNYLWVGPPSQLKTNNNRDQIFGSEIVNVIEMAKKCQNPVYFYCLAENVDYYKKLFNAQNVNVIVTSIDSYLKEMQSHNNLDICRQADKLITIQKELLNKPRDRIVDRVTFKDAFSLFLLATQGGYTIDTGVKINADETYISFVAYKHFKCPYVKNDMGGVMEECWMMYASPDLLEEPRNILDYYLSKWDRIQDVIRGNERKIDNIVLFHTKITALIINSIKAGLDLIEKSERTDPNWEFTLEDTKACGASIAKPKNLPIEKVYGNSHKPEYECREIVKIEAKEYLGKISMITRENRNKLLNTLRENLKKYDDEEDSLKIFALNQLINRILESVKKLDNHVLKLSGISSFYQSKSKDKMKIEFAIKIDQYINSSYEQLDNCLKTEKGNPIKIIKIFKDNIKKTTQDARDYHQKKHPLTSKVVSKSRFETDINSTRKRK